MKTTYTSCKLGKLENVPSDSSSISLYSIDLEQTEYNFMQNKTDYVSKKVKKEWSRGSGSSNVGDILSSSGPGKRHPIASNKKLKSRVNDESK